MKCSNHVNNKSGGLLVEQPLLKSWVLNTTFVEEVQVVEPWDLTCKKRGYMSLGIVLDCLHGKDDRMGMVAFTPGCNFRSLFR